MSFFKSIFEKEEKVNDEKPVQEEEWISRIFRSSPMVNEFVLKLIDEGEKSYNTSDWIVVVLGKYHYSLWNTNYPFAWLSSCYRNWKIPIVQERKIETKLWLPNPYEKVTTYEWRKKLLWYGVMPDNYVLNLFKEYCIKNNINIGNDEKYKNENRVDKEFMEQILSKKEEGK